jgi:hypothetical protein
MKSFKEYIQYIFNEEDAPPPPPDAGGAPPGGPPLGGPPDMGGGPPPDMGAGLPGGAAPKTKMDVYEVWADLAEYLKEKFPQTKSTNK